VPERERKRVAPKKKFDAEFEVTRGVGISTSISMQKLHTVRLTSIYNPQIEGKFTETSGGSKWVNQPILWLQGLVYQVN
jgi:hypothetical protein